MLRPRKRSRHAFSLVEAAVSSALVGLLLVSALTTVRASIATQYRTAERAEAGFLADGLLREILAKAYQDPGPTVNFGCEPGESSSSKTTFDDVDDYTGWRESPPQNEDGSAMTNMDGWERTVLVEWANPASPTQTGAVNSGAKRITVTVNHLGTAVLSRNGIRTAAP